MFVIAENIMKRPVYRCLRPEFNLDRPIRM